MVGTSLYIVIGEGSVTVLEHEAALLLTGLVAPVNIHLAIIRREQSSHALCLKAHVEHVVLAQCISHSESLARSSLCCHGDRCLCDI